MARMYKAVCDRDTVADGPPYQYYKKGETYTISENSPVIKHFTQTGELSRKESEQVEEEVREEVRESGAEPREERKPQVSVPRKPKGLGKE